MKIKKLFSSIPLTMRRNAQLRLIISDKLNAIKENDREFTIRKVVSIYGVLMIVIDFIDLILTNKFRWDKYAINALLSTILIFWAFSAQHYSTVIENQIGYFEGECYKRSYEKYTKWINGDVLKEKKSIWPHYFVVFYYTIWLVASVVITIGFIVLKLYSLNSGILGIINTILLFLVLYVNGNSVFSIGVYTYFLCDLYYSEDKNLREKGTHGLPHYKTMPSYTNGIRRLLRDAKAYSTSFLFVALCFTIQLVICISFSDHNGDLLTNGWFQFIIAFTVLLCFGMYIISTLGARYYIRKLVGLWREETLDQYEKTINKLDPAEDMEKVIQWEQLYHLVEKECISLIPSRLELLFTALSVLINLIPIILGFMQKLP